MRATRREFCTSLGVGIAAAALAGEKQEGFQLRTILASSLYGRLKLEEILPEVRKAGAEHIDIWPERHANQREQMEAMGHEKFAALLEQHGVKLGILTRYDLGPFGLKPEMAVAKKLGASMLISGSGGPKGLQGDELKAAAAKFIEQMKPHVAAAEEAGLVLGIENHGNSLLDSPEAVRRFAEAAPSRHIGVALAPYHLPQDAALLAKLIGDLGDRLVHFYAWQHGKGCMTKLPKEEELLQMPGRGPLDFAPLLAALRKTGYKGWTEVFMHPTPRGIPILPTAAEVTAEVIKAQRYLEGCLK
ncbi:MAG TPA: sugar phosphate isomerase/epimerase [Planctomycetota bacterium]|nr:sugar phosphate isomerase/epimerase [Planctomycetota bacterium]